ncbi:hypothetical protein TH53_00590 [Pedobacter lusitanus]|uniref:Uncharacterized protein n=1 Tax=Pedobacter lusitanus TaxID=1503925 RepID=A0A0D0G2D6_9SPHI|nr:hypothetical protein [Pedobacter lusitanus]KIO78944.1 hypothetical protein TH53_00590 [Pedobacter lusitanus]
MKTDLIEIFQTIRAALQPYTTLGFNDGTNSDQKYDLWAIPPAGADGKEKPEVFFLSLEIKDDHVAFDLLPESVPQHERTLYIKELDDVTLNLIEDKVAAGFKVCKERGWV